MKIVRICGSLVLSRISIATTHVAGRSKPRSRSLLVG